MKVQIQCLVVLQKLQVNLLRGKSLLLFNFASRRKPGAETVVEASPSPAGTTRMV
jgi:hypothetical protein